MNNVDVLYHIGDHLNKTDFITMMGACSASLGIRFCFDEVIRKSSAFWRCSWCLGDAVFHLRTNSVDRIGRHGYNFCCEHKRIFEDASVHFSSIGEMFCPIRGTYVGTRVTSIDAVDEPLCVFPDSVSWTTIVERAIQGHRIAYLY